MGVMGVNDGKEVGVNVFVMLGVGNCVNVSVNVGDNWLGVSVAEGDSTRRKVVQPEISVVKKKMKPTVTLL